MSLDLPRFVPPTPPKKIQVRVVRATFRVDGRTPDVGEVVIIDEDIARGLVSFGKAEFV